CTSAVQRPGERRLALGKVPRSTLTVRRPRRNQEMHAAPRGRAIGSLPVMTISRVSVLLVDLGLVWYIGRFDSLVARGLAACSVLRRGARGGSCLIYRNCRRQHEVIPRASVDGWRAVGSDGDTGPGGAGHCASGTEPGGSIPLGLRR